MRFAIFVLIMALCISVVAAYYSIVGLMAIFAGAAVAVAIMGCVLEAGKLVAASWLYHNWKRAPLFIKSYLTVAVVALMFVTSMGIFGFLSKAHLSQINPVEIASIQVEEIDLQIGQQKKRVERAEQILKRFDEALEVYFRLEYVTRALKERRKQKEEREALQAEIVDANNKIAELSKRKYSYKQEIQETEADVGPIKYIAELVYGEDKAKSMFDEAVRGVIIVLIFVFDPLAVLLIVGGNMSLVWAVEDRKRKRKLSGLFSTQVSEQEKATTPAPPPLPQEEEVKIDEEEVMDSTYIPPHTPVMIPPPPEPEVVYKEKVVYKDREPEIVVKTEEKIVEVPTPMSMKELEPVIKGTFNKIERTSFPYSSQGASQTFTGFPGNLGKILKRAFMKELEEQLKKEKKQQLDSS